ncbi:hypothetical protein MVEN_00710000 [Mycena venus]|uniref:DUF6534 domain-containing protein n=1 Tax=Mycena venus TaxID=2733690 RepID=A0A8H7D5N7_9AGAR|nr:hypothetical protein MVEN_00710000 [Mycena venus]
MAEPVNILTTLGALVVGAFACVALSAVVGFQTFLYFKMFPKDKLHYKILVAWVWITDTAHTLSVCITIWEYGVINFGNPDRLLDVVPPYPAHIVTTLIATLNANLYVNSHYWTQWSLWPLYLIWMFSFYIWRIHNLSGHKWLLTCVIGMLSLTRTALGFSLASEMSLAKKFANILPQFQVVRIIAFSVSATTDISISAARYYYLRELKQGYTTTQEMADAVVIFTINDGLLTSAMAIAIIACVVTMRHNFVWVAIYFSLSKVFANSVLTTLNLRNWYRHRHRPMGFTLSHPQAQAARNALQMGHVTSTDKIGVQNIDISATMEIVVDKEVEYNVGVVG